MLRQIHHVVLNKSSTFNILTSRKEQTSQALSVKEFVISLASASVSIAMMLSENSIVMTRQYYYLCLVFGIVRLLSESKRVLGRIQEVTPYVEDFSHLFIFSS
jgi:hypothetical protein